jgi:chaperonin GroES
VTKCAPKPPILDDAIELSDIDALRLTGPRVLVKRDPPETTAGLIAIPQSAQNPSSRCCTGTVIRCGKGELTHKGVLLPCSVEPGERIMWGFLDGHDLALGDGNYVILEDKEIRAVLE